MEIRYVGPLAEVDVPDAGVIAKRNHKIDVAADVAASLLRSSDWKAVDATDEFDVSGTAADVLERVGDDPAAARAALAAEAASESPRKTLIERLQSLADSDEEE